ncbi:MAG: hypothetical protein KAY65_00065 [Planctomycetes bacterium]|nr:hypothetical protein [Planctomycetota bacterium]
MRCITLMLLLAAAILLMHGCQKAEKPAQTRVRALKAVDQLPVDWDELEAKVRNDSELQERLERFMESHMQGEKTASTKEALKGAYGMLSAHDSRSRAALSAIELFIELDVPEVVREGLRHEDGLVLFSAARFVADRAERGAEDKAILPYLVYVLEKSIDMPGGSDMSGLQKRFILGIQKITDLDVKTGEVDVESTKEVDRFLSLARDWAKANGVKLLD